MTGFTFRSNEPVSEHDLSGTHTTAREVKVLDVDSEVGEFNSITASGHYESDWAAVEGKLAAVSDREDDAYFAEKAADELAARRSVGGQSIRSNSF